MVHRIEEIEPDGRERDRAGCGECEVHAHEPGHERAGRGQELVGLVRIFRAEELHAADPQERQHDEADQDDPGAADELEERAPEQQPARRCIQPDDHRGAGRGEPRDRLEHRVGDGQMDAAELEGQGGEPGDRRPGERGQKETGAQVDRR